MSNAIKAMLQGQHIITFSYFFVFPNFVLLVINSEQSNIEETRT